jgi:hypothetical protein
LRNGCWSFVYEWLQKLIRNYKNLDKYFRVSIMREVWVVNGKYKWVILRRNFSQIINLLSSFHGYSVDSTCHKSLNQTLGITNKGNYRLSWLLSYSGRTHVSFCTWTQLSAGAAELRFMSTWGYWKRKFRVSEKLIRPSPNTLTSDFRLTKGRETAWTWHLQL